MADSNHSASGTPVGYARCSTVAQDLVGQQQILLELGVAKQRIYLDYGLTGRMRTRPGLEKALVAVRAGDTLVVPKLDRLARSVPDARAIADELAGRDVRLQLAGTVYDPDDPRTAEGQPRDRLPGHPTRRAPTARRGRDRRRLSFTLV
jgi:DNA invertase Pin-like site-specific DNA recombinase